VVRSAHRERRRSRTIRVVVFVGSGGVLGTKALQPPPGPGTGTTPPVTTPPSVTEPVEGGGNHPVTGTTAAVTVMVGSSESVPVPSPLVSIASIGVVTAPEGVAIHGNRGVLMVEAASGAPAATGSATVTGTGCIAGECGVPVILAVPITVSELGTPRGPLETFTSPSAERVSEAEGDALRDELLVTVGAPESPGTRGQAEAAATSVGAVVVGGIEEDGIYELRWATAQDLATRIAELEKQPSVTSAAEVPTEPAGEASGFPVAAPFNEPQWVWPFEQVEAQGAWKLSTGSNVRVGIIDMGLVMQGHEDLNVVQYLPPPVIYYPTEHATHVAGLACAKGVVGTVGMAWGCPIVSTEVAKVTGYTKTGQAIVEWTTQSVLEGMQRMLASGNVKVVNLSLGIGDGCTTASQNTQTAAHDAGLEQTFRHVMDSAAGRKVVWTIAAGNRCSPLVASPFGLNSDLSNVITVAATNSDDGLASFSDYGPGVNLAAPGGEAVPPDLPLTNGLMSTLPAGCPTGYCSSYGEMEGTSMAAPVVAGIAADVWEAHPTYTAEQIGACVKSTAGANGRYEFGQDAYPLFAAPQVPFTGAGLPIVDAEAAVECGTYVPRNVSPPTAADQEGHLLPYVGDALAASEGTWTGRPTSYTYKWEGCPSSGPCSAIAGATGSTYTVKASELGDGIRVAVTASNSAGPSSPASSAVTGAVEVEPPPRPKVEANGPTMGPEGLDIPITAEPCTGTATQSAWLKIYYGPRFIEEWTYTGELQIELQTGGPLFNYAPEGVSQISFKCVLRKREGSPEEVVEWTDSGFPIDVTGPDVPVALSSFEVEPGQAITTSDGAPDGLTPCPNIAPYTWQYVEIGTDLPEDGFAIYSGNLARFTASTPTSQYTFSFPEGTPAGHYFVEVNCTAYQAGALPIDYGYLDYAYVKVGHPETDAAAEPLIAEPAFASGGIPLSGWPAPNLPVIIHLKQRTIRLSGTSEEGQVSASASVRKTSKRRVFHKRLADRSHIGAYRSGERPYDVEPSRPLSRVPSWSAWWHCWPLQPSLTRCLEAASSHIPSRLGSTPCAQTAPDCGSWSRAGVARPAATTILVGTRAIRESEAIVTGHRIFSTIPPAAAAISAREATPRQARRAAARLSLALQPGASQRLPRELAGR
jgi:hypothetical protein